MRLPPSKTRKQPWIASLQATLGTRAMTFPKLRHSAPNLSYGRHKAPAYPRARQAANLILIYPNEEGSWTIPLMIRAETEGIHAGEIALPGGRCEPGESARQTALREFHEETGHLVPLPTILGELPSTNVWASNHQVRTFVALEHSVPVWSPDPCEVAGLIFLPLTHLMDPRNFGMHQVTRRRVQFSALHLNVDGHRVWGATLRMLVELGEALTSAK
ncbi:CoA pyrophosphatase [Bremerella sp. JC770]|uniref:NUDIX hydrolase n=1 Tax=Bremerella sp. JC770 TaxID=3232137 RepID=UPI003457C632